MILWTIEIYFNKIVNYPLCFHIKSNDILRCFGCVAIFACKLCEFYLWRVINRANSTYHGMLRSKADHWFSLILATATLVKIAKWCRRAETQLSKHTKRVAAFSRLRFVNSFFYPLFNSACKFWMTFQEKGRFNRKVQSTLCISWVTKIMDNARLISVA